jgi:thiol-disulfide isomerase/thioredoxin
MKPTSRPSSFRGSKAPWSKARSSASRALIVAALATGACSADTTATPGSAPAASASKAKVPTKKPALFELEDAMRATITDGAAYIVGQRSKVEAEMNATGEDRTVVIYVGAPWCEPCRRFHEAVKAGNLDAELPGFVFFELDHDKDQAMLEAMGCTSKLIPLFSVPDENGNCSTNRTEGGIKGDGAVAYMTPKIRALARY